MLRTMIVLSALALALSGCMTVGRPFPTDQVSTLQLDKTTQADIEKTFGPPYRTGIEDGDVTWSYVQDHFSIFGDQQTRDLFIRFRSDGTVKSYSYNTNVPTAAPSK